MNKFNLGRVRGEDGKSATIAIGTVRTGQEGSDASVDNAGDSLRAIFDFTIPRGDKGEKGDRGNEAYTAGSNVQISGGVISATDTTYAPATSSADGLMSKEDKVRLGGVLIDLDSKVDDDDPRLTDAREWSAATVPQDEAEAGTASTRRAWTAQRVWQAINAWWQLVTSGFGRNLIAASNEQAARNVLQLGTAATRDVGTEANQLIPSNVFFSSLQNAGALATTNATYEYDALGRVDKILTPDGDTVIGYNPNGTVETITYPTGRVETFTYDSSGNVVSMTATGG